MTGPDESDDAWRRTLHELDDRAAEAIESGDHRRIAHTHYALAEHVLGIADVNDMVELLLTARESFEEFDEETATRCVVDIALVAQAGGDYGTAAEAFDIGAQEWAVQGQRELSAECLNNFGAMATQLGDYDVAEQALTDAIDIYRSISRDDAIPEVRVNLANVFRLTGRRERAVAEFTELRTMFDSDSEQAAACTQSLAAVYTELGQPQAAIPEFEKAISICRSLGNEEKLHDTTMSLGMALMAVGDRRRGEDLVAAARQAFADAERPDKVAACDYNLANFLAARGDFPGADAAFADAASGLAEAGMHHLIPNLQWNRVKRLFTEAASAPYKAATLRAEAVDTAVAALIGADYGRFQFADAGRRAAWTEMLQHRLTWTFRIVHEFGSTALTADLIESALNGGVYGTAPAPDEYIPLDPSHSGTSVDMIDGADALTMGAAALLATTVLPLAPPPALADGRGRILLARQRRIAAEADPTLRRVLDSAPVIKIW